MTIRKQTPCFKLNSAYYELITNKPKSRKLTGREYGNKVKILTGVDLKCGSEQGSVDGQLAGLTNSKETETIQFDHWNCGYYFLSLFLYKSSCASLSKKLIDPSAGLFYKEETRNSDVRY